MPPLSALIDNSPEIPQFTAIVLIVRNTRLISRAGPVYVGAVRMLIWTGDLHEKKERFDEEGIRVERTVWVQGGTDRHRRERQGLPVHRLDYVGLHVRLLRQQQHFIREPQQLRYGQGQY